MEFYILLVFLAVMVLYFLITTKKPKKKKSLSTVIEKSDKKDKISENKADVEKEKEYNKSEYKKITHKQFSEIKDDKGVFGEYELFQRLKEINPDFKIIPNVYIPSDNGITEVDMILVHTTGIYIFENKNYKGLIVGSEKSRQWKQVIGEQEYQFFSPIIQNKGHVISVMKFLKKKRFKGFIPHHSIIVFPDTATVNTGVVFDKYTNVTTMKQVNVILSYIMSGSSLLSFQDVENIYNIFIEKSRPSDYIKKRHIETVQKAQKRVQT